MEDLPRRCDTCYTNHAEADQGDVDALLTMRGADDVMLNCQSRSYHDALYVGQMFGLRPAPEFEASSSKPRVRSPEFEAMVRRNESGTATYSKRCCFNEVQMPFVTVPYPAHLTGREKNYAQSNKAHNYGCFLRRIRTR